MAFGRFCSQAVESFSPRWSSMGLTMRGVVLFRVEIDVKLMRLNATRH